MSLKKINLRGRSLRRLIALLGLVIGLFYLSFFLYRYRDNLSAFFNLEQQVLSLGRQFSSANAVNFCVLILLTALGSAVPFLSNAVLAVFNGVVFGPWLGLLMNLIANSLGNFLALKILSKITIIEREKSFSEKLDFLKKIDNPYLAISLGYMVPIFPTLLVNYLVIELDFPLKKWWPCVLVGVFPTSCLYAFGGDAILKRNIKRVFILLVLALLVYLLARAYINKRRA
ncbi:membrane protein [Streptococcus criceti]|uniref:Membrane protein n=1 Tax=Streptococcus criceti HS-6 TaxID=873449 RepID=G5JR74_STRCG|nr:VTT domain-containing protein [Streptococcus criceti]EHI75435.1 putative membrane protein [Streptococcus criceti HS-6]SUN42954.1 membrane protein [Streptococcus criceti]